MGKSQLTKSELFWPFFVLWGLFGPPAMLLISVVQPLSTLVVMVSLSPWSLMKMDLSFTVGIEKNYPPSFLKIHFVALNPLRWVFVDLVICFVCFIQL